jgi:peptide methionine sulfoxide reductase msrA/msrB
MNKLTPEEERVILRKGTEPPFSGKYEGFDKAGIYLCKQCDAALYRSEDKFHSACGWPAFDDEIKDAVKRLPDADGRRTEIVCANCGGHLGHVFEGEGFTSKDVRHCVNSISLQFIAEEYCTAYFGAGCFWGVEYYFAGEVGVLHTEVGYAGGEKEYPSYEDVCSGETGHAEVLKVVYNPRVTNYERLLKCFFEIHDPTQHNRQGPDIGSQYRSVIFFQMPEQKKSALDLIAQLTNQGLPVVTEVSPYKRFYKAESYHQAYYNKHGGVPYCHRRIKRF